MVFDKEATLESTYLTLCYKGPWVVPKIRTLFSGTHTHTHPFNGPFSGTIQVSRYQKGKTNLDITEARDSEWQWHELGRMQVCISLQTDNHVSTRMPFLQPSQQSQSTEDTFLWNLVPNSEFSQLFCFLLQHVDHRKRCLLRSIVASLSN